MVQASEYRDDYLKSGKIIEIGIYLDPAVYPIYYDTFNFKEDCIEQRIDLAPFINIGGRHSIETFGPMKILYNEPFINWAESLCDGRRIILSSGCPISAKICQSLREVKFQIIEKLEYIETQRQLEELRAKERKLQEELRKTIRFKSDPRCALLK